MSKRWQMLKTNKQIATLGRPFMIQICKIYHRFHKLNKCAALLKEKKRKKGFGGEERERFLESTAVSPFPHFILPYNIFDLNNAAHAPFEIYNSQNCTCL